MLGNFPVYAVCSAMHFENLGAREPTAHEQHTSVWSFTQKQFVTDDDSGVHTGEEDYVFV